MDATKTALLLLSFLFSATIAVGQGETRLTLTEKDAPLEKVLLDIQRRTGYTYGIDSACLKLVGRVSFSVKGARIEEVLDSCLREAPLFYQFIGKSINIKVGGYVRGLVVNEQGEPIAAATVSVGRSSPALGTMTDEEGRFRLRLPERGMSLVISCIGYENRTYVVTDSPHVRIGLRGTVNELGNVVVSDGFEDMPRERATGSFEKVGRDLMGRRTSPSILDRLDGVTSSFLTNVNVVPGTNQSAFTIRGRSTIFSNPAPLVVVDNFPYNGDLTNINPEDVESVTVLKDAAAASIWGTRAANGVLVIRMKQGKYSQAPRLAFTTSLAIGQRPNIYYTPVLSSSDYIDVEEYLFKQKYYDDQLNNLSHPALPPVVDILFKQQQGILSAAQAASQIDALRRQDVRQDLDRYFYRTSLNQQYWLGCSGGGTSNRYYLSAGLDRDMTNLVGNRYNRITLTGTNTYMLVPQKLEFDLGMAFASSLSYNNNTASSSHVYPYARLVDAQGNALAISYNLSQSYIDTAGGGQLLDWNYRPLDELRNANNITKVNDYRLLTGFHYTFLPGLQGYALYQYSRDVSDLQVLQDIQTYYTRNLINEFTQIDPTGQVTRPVPLGDIFDELVNLYQAHNGRLQVSYDHSFLGGHELHLLSGAEIQAVEGRIRMNRLYGYNPLSQSSLPVASYTISYPQYSSPGSSAQIPALDNNAASSDHYLSYYLNGSYRLHQRYTATVSGRVDESNLFGVNTNKKVIPLWSAGLAWEVSKEQFYRVDWLPYVKLRATSGFNGNVYKSLSGNTTAAASTAVSIDVAYRNLYGASYADIINPPNPNLTWEKVHVVNVGLDFASKGKTVEGSVEYYNKSGQGLIAPTSVDPTTGNTQYTGNAANMVTHGVDLTLRTSIRVGAVRWNTATLFNYVQDKVTRYLVRPGTISSFFSSGTINPLAGKPLYVVYALPWAGLDPQTGDPQGGSAGHPSKDYAALLGSSDFSTMLYKGPVSPPFFGSWRNDLLWRRWGISVNVVYKFGDYFRRTSIQYAALFNGSSFGHPDYTQRWQTTGDEKHTYVPSMVYPANVTRDAFYQNAAVLVEKGDLIRLQDVYLYYELPKKAIPKWSVQSVRLYLYANNIALLWRANRQGIDPDAILSIPTPRTLAVGLKLEL